MIGWQAYVTDTFRLYLPSYNVYHSFHQDFRSLLESFPKCLKKHASSSKPVVLVLDALDQLSDDDAGKELDWVPKQLPDNAYMILSTLPGEEYICLPKLEVSGLVSKETVGLRRWGVKHEKLVLSTELIKSIDHRNIDHREG